MSEQQMFHYTTVKETVEEFARRERIEKGKRVAGLFALALAVVLPSPFRRRR